MRAQVRDRVRERVRVRVRVKVRPGALAAGSSARDLASPLPAECLATTEGNVLAHVGGARAAGYHPRLARTGRGRALAHMALEAALD